MEIESNLCRSGSLRSDSPSCEALDSDIVKLQDLSSFNIRIEMQTSIRHGPTWSLSLMILDEDWEDE